MAYHVALDGPILRVSLSGTLTATEMRSFARELDQLESALPRIPDRIVDMSEVVATGFAFNLTMAIARRRREQVFPNSFRSAIVTPSQNTAGFARIFKILSNNPQIEVKVFATGAEAEEWLGVTDQTS